MVKNATIALLAAVIIAGMEEVAYCRGAMMLGIFAGCMVIVCCIEYGWRKMNARMRKRRRLQRRISRLIQQNEGGVNRWQQ